MTALPIFLRPSVKLQEIDLTQRLDVILSTIGVVVGEFDRGPTVPTYQNGLVENFKALYGKIANPALSFAHDTCTLFMSQSSNLLVHRKTKNALYAGTSVILDRVNNRIVFDEFAAGSPSAYDKQGLSGLVVINVGTTLSSGNTFAVDITDGEVIRKTSTVTFATSHNATMQEIATSIKTTLDTFGIGGTVKVFTETSSSSADNKLIIVRLPNDVSLQMLNLAVAGSGASSVTMTDEARVCDIFAENPGSWANNYGVRVSNIDPGTRERYRLTMSRAFVTGNSVTMTVNGTTVTQAFTTDSDTTLAALAAKIEALPSVISADVEQVAGATDNDRSILVIAAIPGPDALSFITNLAITGGSTQGVLQAVRVMSGIRADNSFYLEVFERSNVNVPVQRHVVSFTKQQDARGSQQNIEQVVNKSSTRSDHIRVLQAPHTLLSNFSLYSSEGEVPATRETIEFMKGGDNGVKCTSAEIRQGWQEIADRRKYPANVLLNAGYTAVSVQKEIESVARKRSDCIGILDAPADRQRAQDLRAYRLEELDIDSSYVAFYTPDVEIEDIDTGERRFVPPSGLIGATYAYSDRLTNAVGAPAGLNRGRVPLALGLRHYYTEAEQELIYPVGINYIEDRAGIGPVVMAEETLQFKKSILSSVHARRILNYIKTGLVDGLDYTLFEPNTDSTRFRAIQLGETLLAPMKKGDGSGGLYDYRIKCDEDNNDANVIQADQLAYDVYLKIVNVIKGINVRAILTRYGASFDETIKEFS